MVKVVVGKATARISVRTSQQPANPTGALKTSAQVNAPRVGHHRVVASVPLLDHAHPVIDVTGLAGQRPASHSVRYRFTTPAQPAATVIGKVYPKTIESGIIVHGSKLVLPIVIIRPAGGAVVSEIAVIVVAVAGAVHAGQFVLGIHRERTGRPVVGSLTQVPCRIIQVTPIFRVDCDAAWNLSK